MKDDLLILSIAAACLGGSVMLLISIGVAVNGRLIKDQCENFGAFENRGKVYECKERVK